MLLVVGGDGVGVAEVRVPAVVVVEETVKSESAVGCHSVFLLGKEKVTGSSSSLPQERMDQIAQHSAEEGATPRGGFHILQEKV